MHLARVQLNNKLIHVATGYPSTRNKLKRNTQSFPQREENRGKKIEVHDVHVHIMHTVPVCLRICICIPSLGIKIYINVPQIYIYKYYILVL